jgi:hypothetical protein
MGSLIVPGTIHTVFVFIRGQLLPLLGVDDLG